MGTYIAISNSIGALSNLSGSGGGGGDVRHIMKWTLTDEADLVVTLWNQQGTITNSYDVDWGDGSSDTGVTTADKSHTYASTGTYEVKITGQFAGLRMGRVNATERAKLTEFTNWGTTQINGVRDMFTNCLNMTYTATDAPDITNLTATSGTELRSMFIGCDSIVTLDLSGWTNTGNFSGSALYAFQHMDSLETLNLTGWDLSSVTDFSYVCQNTGDSTNGCEFIMPNLNLAACTTIRNTFSGANVKSFSINGWTFKSSGTVNAASLFQGAEKGTGVASFTLDLSGWTNTARFNKLSSAFRSMVGLTTLNTTGWDTSNVTTMEYCFYVNNDLTQIDGLSSWSTASITGTGLQYFMYATRRLDFGASGTSNFGTNFGSMSGATTLRGALALCGDLAPGSAPPNVSNWDVSNVTNFIQTFYQLKWTGGTPLDISSWDVSSATTIKQLIYNIAGSSPSLNVSGWELSSSCTDFSQAFRNAQTTPFAFTDSNCDLSGVTTMNLCWYLTGSTSITFKSGMSFAGITDMANALNGSSISTSDYDAWLILLDNSNSNAVVAHFGTSKYTGGSAAATARANLITKGWTITDGGIA